MDTPQGERGKTLRSWLVAHWPTIAQIAAAVLGLAIVTGLVTCEGRERERVYVQALWPSKLSPDVGSKLPVAIHDDLGGPAIGARVRLFAHLQGGYHSSAEMIEAYIDDGLLEVGSGEAHGDGLVILDIPRARPSETAELSSRPAGAEGSSRPAGAEGSDRVLRFIESKTPGDARVTWLLVTQYRGMTRMHTAELAATSSTLGALTLDRPLYQPGQTVDMRLVAVSSETGRPRQIDVTWEVHDPRGNLVMRESGVTSALGIAAESFPLADGGLQGEYQVTASWSGDRVTRAFEVRPFRLPRFKVEVLPDVSVVEPGATLTGKVLVLHTYGEPVEGADVRVDVETTPAWPLSPIRSQTNAEGLVTFEIAVPSNVAGGTEIGLAAVASANTGRTEIGRGSARVAGHRLGIELLAASRGWFTWSQLNRGYVIVADAVGRPIPNAEVTLHLPEERGERETTGTSDAKGRVPISWTPHHNAGSTVSAVIMVDGRRTALNLSPQVEYSASDLRTEQLMATAGDSIAVSMSPQAQARVLALRSRGLPLSAVTVAPGASSAVIEVPRNAAGYAEIVGVSNAGGSAPVPLWIRQPGGDEVSIGTSASHTPGTVAEVQLAFPAEIGAETSGQQPPVAFGLIGVDEALYALEERTDIPLAVVLRETPAIVAAAVPMLQAVDAADPIDIEIAAAKFHAATVGQHITPTVASSDVTHEFIERKRRPIRVGWLVIVGLVVLTLVVATIRATAQAFERNAFTGSRVGLALGTAFAAGLVATVYFGATGPRKFTGALSMWVAIVGCWIIVAAYEDDTLPLRGWLLGSLGAAYSASLGVVVLESLRHFRGQADDAFIYACIVLPAIVFAIEVVLWTFVLLHRGRRKVALGLASLVGLAGLAPLAWTMDSRGRPNYERVAAMPSTFESADGRFADQATSPAVAPQAEPEPTNGIPGTANPVDGDAGPRVRSWFPETMVWLPEIASDAEGRATATFTVPDSVTTFRLNAYANTWDGRFGEARHPFVVIQPYFVELDLPTHLISGDRIEVPVSLVNRNDTPLEVRLIAAGEGVLVVTPLESATFELPPRGRTVTTVQVTATGFGEGSITVTSISSDGSHGDAIRRSARVEPDGRWVDTSTSGLIGDGWDASYVVPPSALAGTAEARVAVYPSLVADALEGLGEMLRQPMGCFEQTSSATYPNVMVLQALRATEPTAWAEGEKDWHERLDAASDLVAIGYQKMLRFQNPDGGFALYPELDSDLLLTAYGLMQLAEMAKVYAVDPNVISRAVRYVLDRQTEPGQWPVYAAHLSGSHTAGDDVGQVRANAFLLLALAMSPDRDNNKAQAIQAAADRIAKRIESVRSNNTLAFAANALVAAKHPSAASVLARLEGSVQRDEHGAYWSSDQVTWCGGYGHWADVETTAVATHAFLEAQAGADLLPQLLRSIARNRSIHGGWGSTHTTAWTLRTLAKLREQGNRPTELRLQLNGRAMTGADGVAAEGTLTIDPSDELRREFFERPLLAGPGHLTVASTERSTAMIQLVTRFASGWNTPDANRQDEPFALELTLSTRDMVMGQKIDAFASVANASESPRRNAIVEAPLPPGAFVETDVLDRLVEQGAISLYEVLPTHVRFYIDIIPAQTKIVLGYSFIPLVRGAFSLPSITAYPFYAPTPRAEADAGDATTR